MARDARVHQFIADLADVRREQVAMAREDALVALVDDQVKVVDLDRIAVPIAPEKFDRLERQVAGFETPHERAAENSFVPPRIHAAFDFIRKSFCLIGRELLANFEIEWLAIARHALPTLYSRPFPSLLSSPRDLFR